MAIVQPLDGSIFEYKLEEYKLQKVDKKHQMTLRFLSIDKLFLYSLHCTDTLSGEFRHITDDVALPQ